MSIVSLPLCFMGEQLCWIGAAGELSESKTKCKSLRAKRREPGQRWRNHRRAVDRECGRAEERAMDKAKICKLEKKCRPCRQNAPHTEWERESNREPHSQRCNISSGEQVRERYREIQKRVGGAAGRLLLFFDYNSPLGGGSTFTFTFTFTAPSSPSPSPSLSLPAPVSPRHQARKRKRWGAA